jgi:hypothetical protein
VTAYRVFLGLFEERERRRELLAHLVFAGLIDVQDRVFLNRSYTTGHKSYRARATVELGDAVGWDDAHDVLYAGVPDMAVGPRWHSAYEMACQVAWTRLAEPEARPKSSMEPSPGRVVEARVLANDAPLAPAEAEELIAAIMGPSEKAWIETLTARLLAGAAPRHILDIHPDRLRARHPERRAPRQLLDARQHSYEYVNTMGWFFDNFEHPHRVKLLYVACSFVHQAAGWVRDTPGQCVERRGGAGERGRADRGPDPRAPGCRADDAQDRRERGVDARLSRGGARPRAARPDPRPRRGQGRQ